MRYIRQETLDEIGKDGQELLSKKTATIIGVGGLGSTVAQLLCRLGIGKLILFEYDKVAEKDLHRQILYNEENIDKFKVEIAKEKLKKINSNVEIISFNEKLTKENISKINADIVFDCVDNLETRFLINQYCMNNKLTWIHGSVLGTIGNVKVFDGNVCFNCIYENHKAQKNDRILNTLVLTIASIQVTEAIKVLLNKPYTKEMIRYNIWTHDIQKIKVNKNTNCKVCK